MRTELFGVDGPRALARVRGYAYAGLAVAQLVAGFLAGGAEHPVQTALIPAAVAAFGLVLIARPALHRHAGSAAPFAACAVVALGMITAPPTIAPFGLALLTMSTLVGGMLFEPRGAAALAAWAIACLLTWSLLADRPVLADAVLGSATLTMAAVVAVFGARVRRQAIDRAQVARRDAEELSLKDPLTGLANRRAFDSEAALRSIERRLGGVLMVDVDHFKRVNDEFGHPVGDEVLVAVARRLTGAVRRADLAARLGGDEFAVLIEGPLTIDGLRRVADAVRGATSAFAAETGGGQVRVTTSIGGALAPADASPTSALRAAKALADRALYEAKQAGRDRAVIDGEDRAPSARRGRRRPRATGPRAA